MNKRIKEGIGGNRTRVRREIGVCVERYFLELVGRKIV